MVLVIALVGAILSVALMLLSRHCPEEGLALTQNARHLHRLKNRTTMPQSGDFNPQVSLSELLRPGDDRSRWSTRHAARIEGYVVAVAYARPEATNCYVPWRRDIHINLAMRKDAPLKEQVVLEVTPNLSDWAAKHGWDWSESALRTQLLGRWCEFEGWLYFDEGHVEESENTSPNIPTNWRATAWEVHPITKIRVLR
jgi:hypothetical protein